LYLDTFLSIVLLKAIQQ